MLVGANIIVARQGLAGSLPDDLLDYKRMLVVLTTLEPVHQLLIWKLYWEGLSMRGIADEWETDELNVIREHKVLLEHLNKCIGKASKLPKLKVRPGLKDFSMKLRKKSPEGQFTLLVSHPRS